MSDLRPCVQCGEMYEATQEHRNYARRFCSSRCAGKSNAERAKSAYPPRDEILAFWRAGETDREIGKRYGRSYQWALNVRRHHNITVADKPSSAPKRYVSSHGYVKVGDRYEHRMVMERKIGRSLTRREVVHHIDGNKQNNDPANLILYPSNSDHIHDERGSTARRPRKRSQARLKRDWGVPREKVEAEGKCRVCGRENVKVEAAHIVPRSHVQAGDGERWDNIVPLCADRCHPAYDLGRLDLLPYPTLGEQASAVELHPGGLLGAYRRLTNQRNPGGS